MKIKYSITDQQIIDMNLSPVPLAVQLRIILNDAGFKFEDDGKPSAIINKNPVPLGIMKSWRDDMTATVHYEQEISE